MDAEKRYNRRVTEGKLAVKLTAKTAGRADWAGMQVRGVATDLGASYSIRSCFSLCRKCT